MSGRERAWPWLRRGLLVLDFLYVAYLGWSIGRDRFTGVDTAVVVVVGLAIIFAAVHAFGGEA